MGKEDFVERLVLRRLFNEQGKLLVYYLGFNLCDNVFHYKMYDNRPLYVI